MQMVAAAEVKKPTERCERFSRPLKKGLGSASFRFERYFQHMSEPGLHGSEARSALPLALLPHVAASSFGSRMRL
jgi:hypothetical protein